MDKSFNCIFTNCNNWFYFSKQVKAMFSIEIVAIMFIIGGIVFFNCENFIKEKNSYFRCWRCYL